jgi:hypothetical protein
VIKISGDLISILSLVPSCFHTYWDLTSVIINFGLFGNRETHEQVYLPVG